MRKLIVLFVISIAFSSLKAQEKISFKKVDSLSYAYFMEGNWTELVEFGEAAVNDGHEYYYLFLRVGIAHYKTGNYYDAEKYLNKGLKSSPNNQLIKEYLYWCYIWRKEYWLADAAYHDLDNETKGWVLHLEKDLLSFWHLGAGASISNLSDSAGNKPYFEIGAYHKFSTNFALYHSYSFLSQELFDGSYNQHQYSIAPNFRLSKKVRLTAAYSFVYNNFDLELNEQTERLSDTQNGTVRTTEDENGEAVYDGSISTQINYFELGARVGLGRISLNPAVGIFLENTISDFTNDEVGSGTRTVFNGGPPIVSNYNYSITEITDKTENTVSTQFSAKLWYTPNLCSDKLTIGANLIVPITEDETNFTISPTITYEVSDNVALSANYLNKENYFIAEGSGTIINNASFLNSKRIGLTALVKLKNGWSSYIIFQNDQIEDNLRNLDYNTNNIIVGLKF